MPILPNDAWRAALARVDPWAARRPATLHAAQLLAARGARVEAEGAYRAVLERQGDHLGALRGLAALCRQAGRRAEAAEASRRANTIDAARLGLEGAEREAVVAYLQAAEGFGAAPAATPAPYVAAIFDRHASRFDRHLLDDLRYRAPSVLRRAVETALGAGPPVLGALLDAGCGTGLAGAAFRDLARRLDGVDLSPAMIERARARGVYDRLDVAEMVEAMRERPGAYDLIVAADVLVYVGDLHGLLDAAAGALAREGHVAFTVEAATRAPYELRATGRYAHHRRHLRAAAAAAGLAVVSLERAVVRHEQRRPVRSHVVLLRKAGAAAAGGAARNGRAR